MTLGCIFMALHDTVHSMNETFPRALTGVFLPNGRKDEMGYLVEISCG